MNPTITPRYYVRVNAEIICNGQLPKYFVTEQAAAEYVWDCVRRGNDVCTYNTNDRRVTRWTPQEDGNGIVGTQVLTADSKLL